MNDWQLREPIFVISPHLDDAVLSCAAMIAEHPNLTVVTVLAGAPATNHIGYNSVTTGATYAPEALRIRRDEDAAALSALSATHLWLDFLDNDYAEPGRSTNEADEVVTALRRLIELHHPATVFSPLGLWHVDHLFVSDVCIEVARSSSIDWYLYDDQPYAAGDAEAVRRRLGDLGRTLRLSEPVTTPGNQEVKRRAAKAYRSQYRPLKRSHRRAFRATMRADETYRLIVGDAAHSRLAPPDSTPT